MNDYLVEENKYLRKSLLELQIRTGELAKDNIRYSDALLQNAHGDTYVAYPHDIAKWALGDKIN